MSNTGWKAQKAIRNPRKGGQAMDGPNKAGTTEKDEELIGILFAISVVSGRLARSLQRLANQKKGGTHTDGKNVGTFASA